MAEIIAPLAAVVKALGNLLITEGKFLHGVKDQVEELQREFNRIQQFLRDADMTRKIGDDSIQQRVLEIKEVAYDAEDLLEGYAIKLGNGTGFLQALNKYACVFKSAYVRHRLGLDIQALNSRIQSLTRSFQTYEVTGVMERGGSSSVQEQLRRTYSFVDEEDFVGLESDVDLLVKHLVQEDDSGVVSISGMGSLGKTTLASKVYKHSAVKNHFNRFAWICVSQQWQPRDILQRILVKLEPKRKKEIEKQREDELISNLFRVLQQTKCLIVLDDIWTRGAWDCIKAAFSRGQSGGKILVTTRNTDVALHIDPDGFHHEPRLLNDDESWELLRRKVILQRSNDKGHDMSDLEILGKKMVKDCGGLPLAVIVLAGILLTKDNLSEWKTVYKNIKSYLWKGKSFGFGKGDLEKILGMSYYDLPFELKPCFLYLGCFPEDVEISASSIYQLWMAEGLVLRERGNKASLLELAELYLSELGQRGMVRLRTLNLPGMRKRFESCRLHDLMRELCLIEAERENFMNSLKYPLKGECTTPCDLLPVSSISKLRRLVITLGDGDNTSAYISQEKEILKHIRMVRYDTPGNHVKGKVIRQHMSIFEEYKMLRSLSIENISVYRQLKLPKAIGGLIHLRYMSTRDCHQLINLPSSLGNLKHLQTLDLRGSELSPYAQNIFLKMKRLICLYLPKVRKIKMQLWNYRIRLRGLDKLEILENFKDDVYETKDLIELMNLRELKVESCTRFENLEMIAKYAQNSNKLQDVCILTSCNVIVNEERGLIVLKQLLFGSNIRRFLTYGPRWKFPEYEPNLSSNILELLIGRKGFNVEENIKTLDQFTCLVSLCIRFAEGKVMCFYATYFPQLKELELYECLELETWVLEEGAMRNLSDLTMENCPMLRAIPDGLRFISSLESLYIYKMPQEFKERIKTLDGREGEDYHKVSHVSSIELHEKSFV